MSLPITPDDIAEGERPPDETLWERRIRALTMRNAGATYQRIATQLSITIPTARKDVRLALREVINETSEDMLARQRSVLLDIQRVNYPAALRGDREAQTMIINALKHEAQLFGLYAPTRVAVGVSDTEFAEQAAELIESLGLEPPPDLRRRDEPDILDVEVAVEESTDDVPSDGWTNIE